MAALFKEGLTLHQQGQLMQAKAAYERVLALQPRHADALQFLGVLAAQSQNLPLAVELIRQAIEINPNSPSAYSNLGKVLKDLNRLEEAVACHDCAIAIKPDSAEAFYNRGIALHELMQLEKAVASYDRAIALKPDSTEAYWNKSLALLHCGRFDEAWPLYEWRWKRNRESKSKLQSFSRPLWLGAEDVANKTVFIYAEQGLGDTLQFSRYARLLAARGARVVLGVPPTLAVLMKTLPGVDQVVSTGDALPAYDYHCPLMSLPLAFGTTLQNVPVDVPYLRADEARLANWRARLGHHNAPRVGLVWSGGHRPDQPELWAVNARRNLPLENVARLAGVPAQFYSLQKGEPAESELAERRSDLWLGENLHVLTGHIHDFADTAALVMELDLVIAVDTSTAHLAAALGKPVWILNRFDACWRWLLGREDSPWYPTVKLYRQRAMGDWAELIERVREDLMAWCAAWRGPD